MSAVPGQLEAALADRYVIERELGRGSTATVYLARDTRHDRPVALKVLRPEIVAVVGAARFLNEIRVTARLNHPHIVPLFDSGEAAGQLYYTMPAMEGETLRTLLERKGQLAAEEALNIASALADAIDYSHQQQVVHRDLKPENILLHRGTPLIADYGIASALHGAGGDRLTSTGITVGTPAYMSPEQAAGEPVGPHTDIYALATLLYEMLAGDPPFSGHNVLAIRARIIREPPTPLGTIRHGLPPVLDTAVLRGLAKVPGERFETAGQLVAAVAAGMRTGATAVADRPEGADRSGLDRPAGSLPRSLWRVGVPAAALAVLALWLNAAGAGPLVPERYALVMPAAPQMAEPGNALRDAFSRWSDIEIVDIPGTGTGLLPWNRAVRSRARAAGAHRYIIIDAGEGTPLRLQAAVHDTETGAVLADTILRHESGVPDAAALDRVARTLLFRAGGLDIAPLDMDPGTRSFRAAYAFLSALEAIEHWMLDTAEVRLGAALAADPRYGRAALWQAQVANWQGTHPSQLQTLLARIGPADPMLADDERTMLLGLQHLASGRYGAACDTYRDLVSADSRSFTGWYGLGECHARDDVVIRDAASPSGWSFRSSHHQAVLAYRQAFLRLSQKRSFESGTVHRLTNMLFTRDDKRRQGSAATPDATPFTARATWSGDSLAFVPYPLAGHDLEARSASDARAVDEAISRQRRLLVEIAGEWVRVFPRSAHAREALAVAEETMGEPASLATLRHARSLTRDPRLQLRLAMREVLLIVRFATPDDITGLERARLLADTLLRAYPDVDDSDGRLAAVAALAGRAHMVADLAARSAQPESWWEAVPLAVVRPFEALLGYAAMGGPADSIRSHEDQVRVAIRNRIAAERQDALMSMLAHPAMLALPNTPLRHTAEYAAMTGVPLLRSYAALAAGDAATARGILDQLRQQRRVRPAARSLDAIYPEVWLRVATGDTLAAVAALDSTLAELRWSEPQSLAHKERAAALVHAMALRAELAAAIGDTAAARRWAAAVVTLWAHGDEGVAPLLARTQRLAQPQQRRR